MLTRLAHRARLQKVLKLMGPAVHECALDYGCGDGLLLRAAFEEGLIKTGYGVDIDDNMLVRCRERFQDPLPFRFCLPAAVPEIIPEHSCDIAICTEVFEHVVDPQASLLSILERCKRGARVIVSTPIEVGPSLLAKQLGRYLANISPGGYGYERYTLSELTRAAILFDVTSFPSSHSDQLSGWRAHKGFDYRTISKLLSAHLVIEKLIFSPFPLFQRFLNSTVIWLCRVP